VLLIRANGLDRSPSPVPNAFAWTITPHVLHPRHYPFAGGRKVNQDPIAEFGVGQAVGLIDPAADGARIAFYLGGKGYNFKQIFKYICRHLSTGFVTVQDKLRTFFSLSKGENEQTVRNVLRGCGKRR
jgi:hypothetical protein